MKRRMDDENPSQGAMREITDAIVQGFEIRRLKSQCNLPACSRKPEKAIDMYEYTMKRGRRVFATLYMCSEHASVVRDMLRKIKETAPQMLVGSDVRDIK